MHNRSRYVVYPLIICAAFIAALGTQALASGEAKSQTKAVLPSPNVKSIRPLGNDAQRFNGRIDRSYEKSKEWWPPEDKPPAGTPNVLLINLDDVGYSQLGSYGGPIDTPNIDALARDGLRYANFHATALCTPSRASILAGRNHHRIGMGSHSLTAMGFPGYNARIPASAKSFANHLEKAGFVNYALGKWDSVPVHQVLPTGPFDQWPSGQGFQQFYGFMAAETNNFVPVLWDGHTPIEIPKKKQGEYHLSEDMADKAIQYITGHVSVAPEQPFFMYWAPGGMHAPHHAPKEYIKHYAGKFDDGWDKLRESIHEKQLELGILPKGTSLTPRPAQLPAWDSLSPDEKKINARQMEAFAGMLTHLDKQVGRMVDMLKRTGQLNNTLILITSDNGASGEGGLTGAHVASYMQNGLQTPLDANMAKYEGWGGPSTEPNYHAGWAWAGNTPFKYFKQSVHNGGVQVPMIIHWPAGIRAKGEVRSQYHHIVDVAPTVFDVTHTKFNDELNGVRQMSLDGVSMVHTFDNALAASTRKEQYFEMWGNRGIYKDGWKAVAIHGDRMPWELGRKASFGGDKWELYHVSEDFSESRDLAAQNPRKLAELKARWDELAWANNVFPLYDDMVKRMGSQQERLHGGRKEFTYYTPGAVRIAEHAGPPIKGRSHSILVSLDLKGQEEGVIVAAGGHPGGYTLFIKDGRLFYEYNAYSDAHYTLTSPVLRKGKVDLRFSMTQTGSRSGIGELYVNGEKVDAVRMPNLHPSLYSLAETFDVGVDLGTPVSANYGDTKFFPFTGELDKVVFRLD